MFKRFSQSVIRHILKNRRYAEEARKAIFFARYEASQFGSTQIESEHLLLGIGRADGDVADRLSGSWETIRKQVEGHTIIRENVPTSANLPLSGESQRILTYAAEEAASLSHKHIGTKHLLLGVLREHSSFAATLLNDRGVSEQWCRLLLLREHPRK